MLKTTREKLSRFNYLLGETEAAYHEVSVKLGCSDSAMKILYAICDNGGCCALRTIRRRSGLSKQTMNSALRKLEAEGILLLENDGAKAKNARLTARGQAVAARTAVRILQIEKDIFACWSEEEVESYLRLTERFLTNFKERAAQLERKETYADPIL